MPRYNLRSSKNPASSPQVSETRVRQDATKTTSSSTSSQDELPAEKSKCVTPAQTEPPAKKSKVSMCRRRVTRRSRKKKSVPSPSSCTIYDLPPDVLLHIANFLDSRSLLSLFQTCHWFKGLLEDFDPFWKNICVKEDFLNYDGLIRDDGDQGKVGWSGKLMRAPLPKAASEWRKVFLRGLQMRRNIVSNNFEGWRIFANLSVPITKFSPQDDVLRVLRGMGNLTKLSANDDIKIDWDEKHLVVFHFFRTNVETCTIWVYNIEKEPKFLYSVNKGIEYTTDRVVVYKGYVVIIPSWPLTAQAVVMTLSIAEKMEVVGKYLFDIDVMQNNIDKFWMHTVLRVVKDKAVVMCRVPLWKCLIVELPSCNLLTTVNLSEVSTSFDCQQIWSYMNMAIVLFSNSAQETANVLVTIDVSTTTTRARSVYECSNIVDVALFTDPEEIYLVKRSGDVVMYDATAKTESMKIPNLIPTSRPDIEQPQAEGDGAVHAQAGHVDGEYQLFVNRREEICVMQSSADVDCGRYIKVYNYSTCQEMYSINLDLWKYGMSRDESICIYTNQAFLAAANSKKLLLFNVKTGQHLGAISIPSHMERSMGKDDNSCMYEPTGLNLFIFDEDKLIAVHDYERSFPAVLDIYKFV